VVPLYFGTTLAFVPPGKQKGDKMNHLISNISKVLSGIALLLSAISSVSLAQAVPPEAISIRVQRPTGQDAAIATLKKNLFRTETYEAPYTVQVPYEATETYTEQVPYEVQVPYTDYETDYRDEERCETVTRYRNEYRCENVTRYRQECRDERRCYIVPGTGSGGQTCEDVEECGFNAHGERICKTRRVCRDNPSRPEERCENQRVCENVPYTDRECSTVSVPYYDRECRTVRVPYERPVTRYRTETRYRSETRTRTVTKYRDEERCCETRTREVFDRQVQIQVKVLFPQDATLVENETESFELSLRQVNPVQVTLAPVNTVHKYQIKSNTVLGTDSVQIELVTVPKYDLSSGGPDSIRGFRASYSHQLKRFVIVVDDGIQDDQRLARLKTTAKIAIQDLVSGQAIEEQEVFTLPNGKRGIVLKTELPQQSKLKAILSVVREGRWVSEGRIEFTKETVYDRKTMSASDLPALRDVNAIKLAAGETKGLKATMLLQDATEDFADVTTTYKVTIMELLANDQRTTLAVVTLSREQLAASESTLKLAELLGNKAAAALRAGKSLRLHIEAQRQSESELLKEPIKLVVKASIKIK
jgi:hypothetical protein